MKDICKLRFNSENFSTTSVIYLNDFERYPFIQRILKIPQLFQLY